MNSLARRAQQDDLVVLYFSSHGTPRERDPAGATYFVAYDTRVDPPDDLAATGLPYAEIYDFVRNRFKSERVLVLMDSGHACQNYELSPGSARAIICASRADERVYESSELRHGYFTYYVLEALRSSHGMISPIELFTSVRDKVSSQVMKDFHVHQSPVLLTGGNDSSFMLGQVIPSQ